MANEKRLIDANALKIKIGHVALYIPWLRSGKTIIGGVLKSYRSAVFEEIDNAPTVDAVEVVRCKDCKHWRENTLWCDMNSRDRGANFNWYADDFCSYGERREGE